MEDVDVHVVIGLANAIVGWAAASVREGIVVRMDSLAGWGAETGEAEGGWWAVGVVVGW